MKISHDSISYAKPWGFWPKLIRPWHRCQSKTLDEQYGLGIRYFDIRIKFGDTYTIYLVHNNVKYDITWEYVYGWLRKHKDCYARIILDQRKKPSDADGQAKLFESLLSVWIKEFNIFEAIIYWNWKHLIKPSFNYSEYHYSVSSKWYEKLLGIKHFAKKNNSKKDYKSEDIMIDYVEYGI